MMVRHETEDHSSLFVAYIEKLKSRVQMLNNFLDSAEDQDNFKVMKKLQH